MIRNLAEMLLRFRNTTNNLEQSCDDMRRFWPDCRVEYNGEHAYYSNVNGLLLDETSFSENATCRGLLISRLRFDECLLLSVPVKGDSAHRFQGKTSNAGKNMAVLQPNGVEIDAWPLTDVSTFQVTISTNFYHQVVSGYIGEENIQKAGTTAEVDLTDKPGRNLAAMTRLMLTWLNSPHWSIEKSSLVLKIFEQQFVQSLVEQQARHWGFIDRQPEALPYYIHLAEEYMRSLPRQAVSLAELARISGVSGRSLQLGFQKYRGYSPVQFSRQIRLESARDMLLKATPGRTVLEIAMSCGFAHISRFAASYQRRFLESPSETLARSGR